MIDREALEKLGWSEDLIDTAEIISEEPEAPPKTWTSSTIVPDLDFVSSATTFQYMNTLKTWAIILFIGLSACGDSPDVVEDPCLMERLLLRKNETNDLPEKELGTPGCHICESDERMCGFWLTNSYFDSVDENAEKPTCEEVLKSNQDSLDECLAENSE